MFRSFENLTSLKNVYIGVMAPVCEKHALTHMELTVLMLLHNNPAHDTATEIVKLRRLTKSHVSISVRSLIEKGLLVGEQQQNDRRTIHLHLTEAAMPIIEDSTAAQRNFGHIMFSGFTKEDMSVLCNMVERITCNINTYEKNGGNSAES